MNIHFHIRKHSLWADTSFSCLTGSRAAENSNFNKLKISQSLHCSVMSGGGGREGTELNYWTMDQAHQYQYLSVKAGFPFPDLWYPGSWYSCWPKFSWRSLHHDLLQNNRNPNIALNPSTKYNYDIEREIGKSLVVSIFSWLTKKWCIYGWQFLKYFQH